MGSGHLLALHRTARDHGRLVADIPPAQADQERGACRAPRPCHHLPTSRGCRHRRDGPCHPCRPPPIASAAVMRVTAKLAKTERKRQDNSGSRVTERSRRVKLKRVQSWIRPTPGVSAPPDTDQSAKRLICLPVQATLTLSGSLLWECRRRPLHSTCLPSRSMRRKEHGVILTLRTVQQQPKPPLSKPPNI